MFEPHKVKIEERKTDGETKYWLVLEAPIDVEEPKLVKDSKGNKKYTNFAPNEMKPSSSGKTFKLFDLGKGDSFSCRHPLTGDSLTLSARLNLTMANTDERKIALMDYAEKSGA
jgi:hypothetical protein